jgi:hypothetical protein
VEHWPVRSARTEAWLRRLYGQVYKRLVPKVAVEDVVADLRATGLLFGEVHPVFTRLGGWKEKETGERRVYLDLARPDWTVVEVTAEGWRVIPASEAIVGEAASQGRVTARGGLLRQPLSQGVGKGYPDP